MKKNYTTQLQRNLPKVLWIVGIVFFLVITMVLRNSKAVDYGASAAVSGNTYFVSLTGNDANPGTESSPFKTFNYAASKLAPGDSLKIAPGIYNEKLTLINSGTDMQPINVSGVDPRTTVIDVRSAASNNVEIRGSYINLSNLGIKNATSSCVSIRGNNVTVSQLDVSGCKSHGINAYGKNIHIENNTVHDAITENVARTAGSGWGSAIKTSLDSEWVFISNNTVFHNYGEGIATTRSRNIKVENNFFYDNYSVNIYVDNSINVSVANNLVTCTTNTQYYRSGYPASAIALGEEDYSGDWGYQLANVSITNNLSTGCEHGVVYWKPGASNGGMDTVSIKNNTFYGTIKSVLSLEYSSLKTRNTVISNNVFHSPNRDPWIENRAGITMNNNYWINRLPSSSSNAIGQNDLFGNPLLLTTPVYNSAESFKISSNSPLINRGHSNGVLVDYFGTPRPQGGALDIGGYEYGGSSSTTPSSSPTSTPTPTPPSSSTPSPTTITPTPTTTTTNHLPRINTSSLADGRVKSSYRQVVVGYDEDISDTLSMTITGLPRGLSFGSCSKSVINNLSQIQCSISGKPRSRGTSNPVIKLVDNRGGTVTRTFSLTIN